MSHFNNRLLPLLLIFIPMITTAAETVAVSQFNGGSLDGWKEKSFVGNTQYQLIKTENGTVLQARSNGTASGLFKKMDIDLRKTPYLNWSWRIENTFVGNNERTKAGDDYPARIYVVVSGGIFFWRTRALNYVWSSNQPIETRWNNAFTSNAKMVAVRSGEQQTNQWISEKRNVFEDLKEAFGKEIDKINAVAIMTDSDNTGGSASAMYGEIYFSEN